MGVFRCSARTLGAAVVAGLLALLLTLAGVEAARAISDEVGPLTLEPSSGERGIPVGVSAGGFGPCVQDEVEDPEVENPEGEDPQVNEPQVNALLGREAIPGTVVIIFDQTKMGDPVTVQSNGSITASFDVPEAAKPGTYTVRAECVQNTELVSSAEFQVTEVEQAIVPNLGGMDRTEAEDTLVENELVLGQTTGNGDTVQSQQPPAGTRVPVGTAVDVAFGTVQPTVVPRIVGLLRAQAQTALRTVGLRLGRVSGRGDVVRSQDPEAGTKVSQGSRVNITVGSVARLVVVPRLMRMTTEAAASLLADRGLVLGPVDGDGDVIREQFPEAGAEVPVGSAVSVTTVRDDEPPVLVQVPNVVGRTVNAARTALTDAGLVLGGQPAADRTVASQKPAAGTFVSPRSPVTVTLVALPLVRVPDLVGSSVTGARTALSALGLRLGGSSDSDRDIVSQQPAAGMLVPVGTVVTATFGQSSSPWPAAAVLAALLLGAGAVIYRVARLRLDHGWVHTKVKVVPRQSALVGPRITESNRSPAMPVVRIEPHADTGTHTLEEV